MCNCNKIYKIEELVRGTGVNSMEYFLPDLNKWVNNKHFRKKILKLGYKSIRHFFNKYVLGVDDPEYNPGCSNPNCNNKVNFASLSHGYRKYCCNSCSMKDKWWSDHEGYLEYQRSVNPTYGPRGMWGYMENNPESEAKWRLTNPTCFPGGMHYYLLNTGNENYINFMKNGGVFGQLYRKGISFNGVQKKYETGTYISLKCDKEIHYRSSYELRYLRILDKNDDVESFEYESVFLEYEYEGSSHIYIVDFLVHYKDEISELKEVKPKSFLKLDIVKMKMSTGINYAESHGMRYGIISEDDLEYLEEIFGIFNRPTKKIK